MAASFPRVTVLIFLWITWTIKVGIFREILNCGQRYFPRLTVLIFRFPWYTIRFDLVCDDYWYWYYKYLTMENDGSFVPQAYGVDISWSSIFRNLFGRSISWYNKIWFGLWRLLVLILQIFNDGERWQLRSPGLRCWCF